MTIALLLVLLSVGALFFLARMARGQSLAVHDLSELEGRTQPVDLPAFRNLIDAGEEDYLRRQLSPALFRAIQRQRMKAAVDYVRRIAQNASILLRLGEAVREHSDPEIAAAGRELVTSALLLRMNAMLSLAVLYVRIVAPGTHMTPRRVVDTYQHVTDRVVRLTRLQNPAYAARVAAVI